MQKDVSHQHFTIEGQKVSIYGKINRDRDFQVPGEMVVLSFAEGDIQELNCQRFYRPHPCIQQKITALLFKAKGLSHP